eukprot:TRINITY_DN35151_c0_g1_i1.p1 TRINITY_DN35151_c0_g1~~TRINITY_DN35151_c0_g1_i1.p1  ORF type:complete len:177 (-),score=47.35 TRINITY_DN35151_c0_g1_i1:60-590(-)
MLSICSIPPSSKFDTLWTEAHKAAELGDIATIRELIKEGADVDVNNPDWGSPLYLAIVTRHPKAAYVLLTEGKANPNIILKSNDTTPLHVAAAEGYVALAKGLIDAGADINRTDIVKHTPLHNATFFGRVEISTYLLEAGCETNLKDIEGYTPLRNAERQYWKKTEALLRKHGVTA